ncbi:MAG: hypothetical protein IID41_18610 [Planctomycetes bacterium]|nr:hypothetical protein [Planctomycetota bacterium]
MKSTTWILITLAVAVTASMVVAKSIILVPQKAEAQPAQPDKVVIESAQVRPVTWAVGQRAPQSLPTLALFEPAPRVSKADAKNDKSETGTVLVVNGNIEEHVTYANAEVKSPTP